MDRGSVKRLRFGMITFLVHYYIHGLACLDVLL